ncbi:MAG: hypothetical protein WA364_13570 [Candidatus Nitrosopolaris sp.]
MNVQRAIILPHRQDGKDYTGILTFSASKPVEIVLGHRIEVDKSTLSAIDIKRFGNPLVQYTHMLVTCCQHHLF